MPDLDELTPEQVRSLLREAVTVVKPGEVLILRVSENFTPNQLREYQESLTWWCRKNAPDIKILAVVGEGGTIVRQEASLTDLVWQGDISVNTARAAMGFAPFDPPIGPLTPILPVPIDIDPDAPRPEPRRWEYHVGGTCATPRKDGTCGCGSRAAEVSDG